jgi:large subunit ribosomal protein L4|tara:strand:- start:23603 stop:24235 length:633 start_codon:yes stop_codon:yes gene_type:complete
MVKIKVINFKDSSISDEEVKLIHEKSSDTLLSFALRSYRSSVRSATARVKEMSEISGTTAKPHSQKGTGKARQGSKRSVQFRGGRSCFGPKGRIFEFDLPKKMKKKAISDALFSKIEDNKLLLLSDVAMEKPQTKNVVKFIKDNKIENSVYFYNGSDKNNESLVKSIKNIKNFHCKSVDSLNIYDLFSFDKIILQKEVLDNIGKYLQIEA